MAKGRKFSMVSPLIWKSKRFKSVSEWAQLLHLYFITCQHQNSAGICEIPDGYALADLSWEDGAYWQARRELIEADLIMYDSESDEIYIRRWFQHNPPTNEKHRKGTEGILMRIYSDEIREQAMSEFEDAWGGRCA